MANVIKEFEEELLEIINSLSRLILGQKDEGVLYKLRCSREELEDCYILKNNEEKKDENS